MILAEAKTRLNDAMARLEKILTETGVEVARRITYIDRDFRELAEPQGIVQAIIGQIGICTPEMEDGEEYFFSAGADVSRTGHVTDQELDDEIAGMTREVTEFAEKLAAAEDKTALIREKNAAEEEEDRKAAIEVGKLLKKMKVKQAILVIGAIGGILLLAFLAKVLGG